MLRVKRLYTSEILVVVEDAQTGCVQFSSEISPVKYLDDLRSWSQNPEALSILAIAPRVGRAIRLLKLKLKAYRLRGGGSWYSSAAREIIVAAAEAREPYLRLDGWINALISEAKETGAIAPLAPIAVVLPADPEANGAINNNTRLGRVRTPKPSNMIELYDHPRRRRGRPRKHFQNGADSCACGAFWPCARAAQRAPTVSSAEKHQPNGDLFRAPAEKPHPEPPAWALALARRARRSETTSE